MCDRKAQYIASNNAMWTFVGEWVPTLTDCAGSTYVSEANGGSIYDATNPTYGNPPIGSCKGLTGSATGFSESYKTFMRQYWEVSSWSTFCWSAGS